jgi:hypothetical protein
MNTNSGHNEIIILLLKTMTNYVAMICCHENEL